MQVNFTPEQEKQLAQFAVESGTVAEQLVKEAALRLLDETMRFRAGVQRGIAAADRGEFIESAEVWARVEAVLQG
jgi:predicted transcriptional regulator